jgi:cobalt-zinc-cadmium efflux system outer membrane protein
MSPSVTTWLGATALATCWLLGGGCSVTPRHDRPWLQKELGDRLGGGLPLRAEQPSGEASLPSGVSLDGPLGEREAVSVALWNNATLQAELAQLGLARADLYDAGLLPNPTFLIFFPLGPKQLEFRIGWPIEWLWQRPSRLKAAHRDAERLARTLVSTGLDLVRDVKSALVDLWLAQERSRLRQEAEKLWREIGTLTEARLRAGDISEVEASGAKVESLAAAEQAKRARREVSIVEARLRALLGVATLHPAPLSAAPPVGPAPGETLPPAAELERSALAGRPDLRAAELAIEAAAARVGVERARIVQAIGYLDAVGGGLPGTSGKQGALELGPGLMVTLPIFNQNQAGRSRAHAELLRAAWRYVAVQQAILSEVRQAREQVLQADEALAIWSAEVVQPLEANVKSSLRAYQRGADAYLIVLDATRRFLDAELRQAELRADGRRARAQLERSLGRILSSNRPPAR